MSFPKYAKYSGIHWLGEVPEHWNVTPLKHAGCTMQPEQNVITLAEVMDAVGNNRLAVRFIEKPLPNPQPGRKGYDFHSLVWEVKDGDAWKEKVVITKLDFEKNAERRGWVNEIHSFDSVKGCAVVRVGEEQPREVDGTMHVEYSWRDWDLVNNRQIQVLRVCKSPFETVDGKVLPRRKSSRGV